MGAGRLSQGKPEFGSWMLLPPWYMYLIYVHHHRDSSSALAFRASGTYRGGGRS